MTATDETQMKVMRFGIAGLGIASTLLQQLCEYARTQGIQGIKASILSGNRAMVQLHRKLGHPVRWDAEDGRYHVRFLFDVPEARHDATVPPSSTPAETA